MVKPELEKHLTDLKDAAERLLRQSMAKANETVTGIKDQAIETVNATFEDLFDLLQALPEKVRDTIDRILLQIDSAFDETVADARQTPEQLVKDLRMRLEDSAQAVADAVQGIIDGGFALIHEARDLLV